MLETANYTNVKARELRKTLYLCAKVKLIESQRKKNIGKPYEGKPHVRIDEGKLEQKRDGKAISKTSVSVFYSTTQLVE